MNIEVGRRAKALLTTPSAGKVYASDQIGHPQIQSVTLNCDEEAELEWLPQGTIVYDGANGYQNVRLNTRASSKFTLWDITALGRPASAAPFVNGSFIQKTEVNREGQAIFLERMQFEGGGRIFDAPWGLNGHCVYGSMIAGYFAPAQSQSIVVRLREHLAVARGQRQKEKLYWAASRKDNLLVLRALAAQSEPIKQLFSAAWDFIRPTLLGKITSYPRIWST
ncbi:MAG: urease accessory protein UreD [Proteobacteria bacterium]|nr:urease accessory protein UreD [Pseudomonadota bacterium]